MESNSVSAASNPADVPYTLENSKTQKNRILKPIRQEKVLKVPVTKFVENIIEKEEIKYVNKYVDVIKPIVTCKTKHVSKPVFLDKIKYEPRFIEKEKIIHVPKIEYRNKIVEIPVYIHKQNIIEKKVPIIVERVIPVLKVKKVEKTVVTNTVEISNLCKSEKNEMSVNTNFNRYSEDITGHHLEINNMYDMGALRENEESYSKETYVNVESVNKPSIIITPPKTSDEEVKEFADNKLDNSNNVDTEVRNESSFNEKLEHNNETMYNEESNEEAVSENAENMMVGKSNSVKYLSNNLNENNCDVSHVEENKSSYASRISVHIPGDKNISKESIEKQYVNLPYNNNSNMNYSMNMSYTVNDDKNVNYSGYINKHESDNMNGLNSQYYIRESYNDFKNPTVQNMEAGVGVHSYSDDMKKASEIERQKQFNLSNVNITNVNYASSQHGLDNSQYITGAPRMMPSFANKNGQAFVSVRPATILEFNSKPKKSKTSICNFMNKCCGGN